MQFITQLGLDANTATAVYDPALLRKYVNLKLTSIGQPSCGDQCNSEFFGLSQSLLASYQEQSRLLADYLPCDQRIQRFIDHFFAGLGAQEIPQLPHNTLILDRHGLARTLSLPAVGDHFSSDIIDSYRIHQGVLHNPKHDRRTTHGVFHIAKGGLPIPNDKKAVPLLAAARLLAQALQPPPELTVLPFLAHEATPAKAWASLLLRPVVLPAVADFCPQKSMEVRFFAPGNLVSNLDFVESIFGNGGDPFIADNDAGLDPEHWTGHTGCVILAPQLTALSKAQLGLPHRSQASARQQRDGMCWQRAEERYNDGVPFKITYRDASGCIVTVIADNYFGYCKKEVKTQISFAANLHGLAEEEHAGGTLVFTGYDLGEDFQLSEYTAQVAHSFAGVVARYAALIDVQPQGYAIDKHYQDIIYLPADARIQLRDQSIRWHKDGVPQTLKLLADHTYLLPSGYKVQMLQPKHGRRWRLVGHTAESCVCHKPSTVSGGGKSEISKSISGAMISGPVFVGNFEQDFERAEKILGTDFGTRFKHRQARPSRPILSPRRSLGSVIKLLTPSQSDYTAEYNAWLESIPQPVKELVLIIKRFYKPHWGKAWRSRFSVDLINGAAGNVLRYRDQPMRTDYLRVGYTPNGSWRTFGLRKDFMPAAKISLEDDITASVVAPSRHLKHLPSGWTAPAAKCVHNCEYRFFQRPDDAIVRGCDQQAESDLSSAGSFLSNYAPLTRSDARQEIDDAIRFSQYTAPMQAMIRRFSASSAPAFYASNARPRLVDGAPTKNPRYLQVRPDLRDPRSVYLADISSRLYRRQDAHSPLLRPVTAILPGRRNHPADPATGVKPLCVYNPIHYLPLPELFMEFIASVTGKSPSTTGAGSEGALTKGPFNAMPPIYDLNNALVAYLATEQPAFVTAAGYIGPKYRIDHDISLLIPEIWCRLKPHETQPQFLMEHGYLEKVEDFTHNGAQLQASRIGYRITAKFVRIFFGRIFSHPTTVIEAPMLQPERQDLDTFVTGIQTIVAAHQQAALHYFEDGSIAHACPPLRALLHIMRDGSYHGEDLSSAHIRGLFTRSSMLDSEWYQARLNDQQAHDCQSWAAHVAYLQQFLAKASHAGVAQRLQIDARLTAAKQRLEYVKSEQHLADLRGTLGRQPIQSTKC